tara:strand:+ start:30 stop:482 length:453 start_codon:yes stop_codon:yes gene_type:complete
MYISISDKNKLSKLVPTAGIIDMTARTESTTEGNEDVYVKIRYNDKSTIEIGWFGLNLSISSDNIQISTEAAYIDAIVNTISLSINNLNVAVLSWPENFNVFNNNYVMPPISIGESFPTQDYSLLLLFDYYEATTEGGNTDGGFILLEDA